MLLWLVLCIRNIFSPICYFIALPIRKAINKIEKIELIANFNYYTGLYSAKVAVWGRSFDFERGKGCHFLISWPSQDLKVKTECTQKGHRFPRMSNLV
jgi:hypothetical protein